MLEDPAFSEVFLKTKVVWEAGSINTLAEYLTSLSMTYTAMGVKWLDVEMELHMMLLFALITNTSGLTTSKFVQILFVLTTFIFSVTDILRKAQELGMIIRTQWTFNPGYRGHCRPKTPKPSILLRRIFQVFFWFGFWLTIMLQIHPFYSFSSSTN